MHTLRLRMSRRRHHGAVTSILEEASDTASTATLRRSNKAILILPETTPQDCGKGREGLGKYKQGRTRDHATKPGLETRANGIDIDIPPAMPC